MQSLPPERLGAPFANTLDARSFIAGPIHEEAVARLLYLIENRLGCGLLWGQQGTGKSLVLRVVCDESRRTGFESALVDLAGRSSRELLWDMAGALGLGPQNSATARDLWRMMDDYLRAGRQGPGPVVLCFDHLDRADERCLTVIDRLYRTAQACDRRIALIVSVRQSRILAELSPIADIQVELVSLDRRQTGRYIAARLAQAGAVETTFDESAAETVFAVTGGVPRDINRVCELALIAGFSRGEKSVSGESVSWAAKQLLSSPAKGPVWRLPRTAARAG